MEEALAWNRAGRVIRGYGLPEFQTAHLTLCGHDSAGCLTGRMVGPFVTRRVGRRGD